jgi:hypothetical protein
LVCIPLPPPRLVRRPTLLTSPVLFRPLPLTLDLLLLLDLPLPLLLTPRLCFTGFMLLRPRLLNPLLGLHLLHLQLHLVTAHHARVHAAPPTTRGSNHHLLRLRLHVRAATTRTTRSASHSHTHVHPHAQGAPLRSEQLVPKLVRLMIKLPDAHQVHFIHTPAAVTAVTTASTVSAATATAKIPALVFVLLRRVLVLVLVLLIVITSSRRV